MRKHLFYLSMVLVLTLFSACGGGKKGVFTPTSSGRAYEVLVVLIPWAVGSLLFGHVKNAVILDRMSVLSG